MRAFVRLVDSLGLFDAESLARRRCVCSAIRGAAGVGKKVKPVTGQCLLESIRTHNDRSNRNKQLCIMSVRAD